MKISYAAHADVLYIVFTDDAGPCAYVELDSGVICRINESTDKVVGITIPHFRRRSENGDVFVIPELTEGIAADKLLEPERGS